jgi:hypothetical protein
MKIASGILALCCFLSAPAFASEIIGRVVGIMPLSSGTNELVIFRIENATASGCNTTARYAMSSANPKYKGTFATLLAAYHAGTQVRVWGAGTCATYGDSEDVSFICDGYC